jgi:hypothetical protein
VTVDSQCGHRIVLILLVTHAYTPLLSSTSWGDS